MRRIALIAAALLLAACQPEVGSPKWCERMEKKGKSDWTLNEASDYAAYCVLGMKPEKSR